MNRVQPTVVCVADIAAVPWRNGGGVTRELLAWPDPQDWVLRVSVADIGSSGPFSAYPGVDRWFAVLAGGAIRLDTAGTAPKELTASQSVLHAFPGDATTHCTALGPATRDFNLMLRRARARLVQQPLEQCPLLKTQAAGAGLFVVEGIELSDQSECTWRLPAMALAWWPNPRRVPRSLQAGSAHTRGWWFEVETDLARPR